MRTFPILIATSLAMLVAVDAQAQTAAGVPPAPGRYTVSINGGFQSGSQDISRSSRFPLYDEEASIDTAQNDIKGGGFFEIGGSARVRGNLGAGISYSSVSSDGTGTVNGSIPHPQVFDQPRTLTASASGLEHKERGVHVYATWFIPYTEKLDFTLSAGPSFFNITQAFIGSVTFSETPPFDAVTVDEVALQTHKKNAVGINVGADVNYAITRLYGADVGAGMTLRFTRGSADFTVGEGEEISVDAGGFQIGFGVRVRFDKLKLW